MHQNVPRRMELKERYISNYIYGLITINLTMVHLGSMKDHCSNIAKQNVTQQWYGNGFFYDPEQKQNIMYSYKV